MYCHVHPPLVLAHLRLVQSTRCYLIRLLGGDPGAGKVQQKLPPAPPRHSELARRAVVRRRVPYDDDLHKPTRDSTTDADDSTASGYSSNEVSKDK